MLYVIKNDRKKVFHGLDSGMTRSSSVPTVTYISVFIRIEEISHPSSLLDFLFFPCVLNS